MFCHQLNAHRDESYLALTDTPSQREQRCLQFFHIPDLLIVNGMECLEHILHNVADPFCNFSSLLRKCSCFLIDTEHLSDCKSCIIYMYYTSIDAAHHSGLDNGKSELHDLVRCTERHCFRKFLADFEDIGEGRKYHSRSRKLRACFRNIIRPHRLPTDVRRARKCSHSEFHRSQNEIVREIVGSESPRLHGRIQVRHRVCQLSSLTPVYICRESFWWDSRTCLTSLQAPLLHFAVMCAIQRGRQTYVTYIVS